MLATFHRSGMAITGEALANTPGQAVQRAAAIALRKERI